MIDSTDPAESGLKTTSTVCSPMAGSETDCPQSTHEKAPGTDGCETEMVAGSTPSLRSVICCREVRPTSSRANCSSGAPSAVTVVGLVSTTCGSVPSAIMSKVSCFVAATVPSSTLASKVAKLVHMADGVK